MSELKDWDTTAANNDDAPPDGFPENMEYSEVNDAARELMAVLARWFADTNASVLTTGAADAYVLTTSGNYTAYADGDMFGFDCHVANTGATTINVDSLGAQSITLQDGSALTGGELQTGGKYLIVYDGTNFQLLNSSKPDTSANVVFSSTDDVDLVNTNNTLNLGDIAGNHIALDGNEIQAKDDATTAGRLDINASGGAVVIGEGAVVTEEVQLRNRRTSVEANISDALHVANEQDGAPAIGTAQDVYMRLNRSDGTQVALFGYASSTALNIRSLNDGALWRAQANDNGGTLRTVIEADPDDWEVNGTIGSGSFTADFSNDFSGTVNTTVRWQRLGRLVTLFIDAFNGTSNGTGFAGGSADVPSAIRPAANVADGSCRMTDNGSTIMGEIEVTSSGFIAFSTLDVSGSNITSDPSGWTNSGTKGLSAGCKITYRVS